MKRTAWLTVLTLLFIACNNSGNKSLTDADSVNNNKPVKANSDSLMAEVMEDHNIGMAKMSRINESQKKIQRAIDSVAKLPPDVQANSSAYKMLLDSTLSRLKYANEAMDKWMEEFNMDSASNNEDKRIEYLRAEKTKISKVKDVMISSLQKADSILMLNH
jgi:hypothetical protein